MLLLVRVMSAPLDIVYPTCCLPLAATHDYHHLDLITARTATKLAVPSVPSLPFF